MATVTTTTSSMAPGPTTTVPKYSFFVGDWAACGSTCGEGSRTREIGCHLTCTLWRCPTAPASFCSNLTTPASSEACVLPPCPPVPSSSSSAPSAASSSTARPTTSLAGTSTTSTAGVVGDVVIPAGFECLDLVPGGFLPLDCLDAAQARCGSACPCCRATATLAPTSQPSPSPAGPAGGAAAEPSEPHLSIAWTAVLVLAVGFASSLVLGFGVACYRAHRKSRANAVVHKPPPFVSARVGERPVTHVRPEVPHAWASPQQEEAWAEPVESFHDGPPLRSSAGGSPHGPSPSVFGRGPPEEPRRSARGPGGVGGAPSPQGSPGGGVGASPGSSRQEPMSEPSPRRPPRARGQRRSTGGTPGAAPRSPSGSRSGGGGGGASSSHQGAGRRSAASPRGEAKPPPASGASSPSSSREEPPGSGGASPHSVPATPTADVGADPVVVDLVERLARELDEGMGKDLDWRKQHFKTLMLTWHPDKNRTQTPEQASAVFRYLLSRRARYLEA